MDFRVAGGAIITSVLGAFHPIKLICPALHMAGSLPKCIGVQRPLRQSWEKCNRNGKKVNHRGSRSF